MHLILSRNHKNDYLIETTDNDSCLLASDKINEYDKPFVARYSFIVNNFITPLQQNYSEALNIIYM